MTATLQMAFEPEWRGNACRDDDETAERRTERARNIHADAVGGNCRRQIVARHQQRYHRLPGRRRQGACGIDEKREQQQVKRRRQVQAHQHRIDCRHRRRQRFKHDQEAALVENVGERASRQREHEHRQCGRRLNQRHDQRIGIEVGHQPAGGRAVHPAADIGDQRCRPDHPEGRLAKRSPRRQSGRSRRSGGSRVAHRLMPAAYARASGRPRRRRTVRLAPR